MGTNYYLHDSHSCECCGHVTKPNTHIGKSSFGWKFLFQGEKFKTAKEWAEHLVGKSIFTEDGTVINDHDFWALVSKNQKPTSKSHNKEFRQINSWIDADGFEFYNGEFF